MARTSRAERNRRRESALTLVSEGKGFSDVVTAQMAQWGCSRSSAQRDCRWAHNQLQLGMDSHDAQHLMVHMATSLQRIALKAEQDKQYGAAVGAQKMLYELLLRRRLDDEAEKAKKPGWGYRHGNNGADRRNHCYGYLHRGAEGRLLRLLLCLMKPLSRKTILPRLVVRGGW